MMVTAGVISNRPETYMFSLIKGPVFMIFQSYLRINERIL